jgi:hypothetical protein
MTGLLLVVLAAIVLILMALVVVVVGIRHEPPSDELSSRPPTRTAAMVRRFLGVSVRKPNAVRDTNEATSHPCLAAHGTRHEGPDQ